MEDLANTGNLVRRIVQGESYISVREILVEKSKDELLLTCTRVYANRPAFLGMDTHYLYSPFLSLLHSSPLHF